jgi:hypothetical protein
MTPSDFFLFATACGKAAGDRPDLSPGTLPAEGFTVTRDSDGATVHLSYSGVSVGAPTEARATVSLSRFGLVARCLARTGCTREAILALVAEEAAAELRGEHGDAATEAAITELAEGVCKALAATLPTKPRAGAVQVKGAAVTFSTASAAAAK